MDVARLYSRLNKGRLRVCVNVFGHLSRRCVTCEPLYWLIIDQPSISLLASFEIVCVWLVKK